MPVRIKVDEDLPAEVTALICGAGHDAQSVVQQLLMGSSDSDLWKRIQDEGRCLVTADKGFADERSFPPGSHAGVVLLRLPRESRSGYLRLTKLFLERINMETVVGSIVVVTPDAVRVRRGS